MTTNKVHDPKNCEKQQPPTSVTGDGLKQRFMREYNKFLTQNNLGEHDVNCYGIIEDWVYYIESELLAQRTHIKQALLGRSKKLKWKYSNDLALDENSLIHKLETVDDTELFINEELA